MQDITNEQYQEYYPKVRAVLEEGPTNYKRIAERLTVPPEFVRAVVGRKFVELTDAVSHALFSDADDEFYLLGENIEELRTNKQYKRFKDFKRAGQTLNQKTNGLLGRFFG